LTIHTADKGHAVTVVWDHCPELMDFVRSY
jgi:hypothetical protein